MAKVSFEARSIRWNVPRPIKNPEPSVWICHVENKMKVQLPEPNPRTEQHTDDLAMTTTALGVAYEQLFVTGVFTKMKYLNRQGGSERSSLSRRRQLSSFCFPSNCPMTMAGSSNNVARREGSGSNKAHAGMVDCS